MTCCMTTVGIPLTGVQLPVCSQVDAADSQVVSGPDEPGLQIQCSSVRLHRLLAAVPISQRCSQPVPQQVVLKTHKKYDVITTSSSCSKVISSFNPNTSSFRLSELCFWLFVQVLPAACSVYGCSLNASHADNK